MNIIIHQKNGIKIAEVGSKAIIIAAMQDALDLMVDPELGGVRRIIIKRENIVPEFFDLSTRIAGEILQKFANYRIKLAIVGDFSDLSKTFNDFAYESNRGNQIFFCSSADEAKQKLYDAE